MLCFSRRGNVFLHFGTLSVQNCQNKEAKACCWKGEALKLGKNSSCGTGSFPKALDGSVVSAWCFQRAMKVLSCQSTEGHKAPRPLVLSLSDDLSVSNKVLFFGSEIKSHKFCIALNKFLLVSLKYISYLYGLFHFSIEV